MEYEKLRITAFDSIRMEDGEWDGPILDEYVLSYKAKTNGVSLLVSLGGKAVFDGDYNKGVHIRIVGNIIHLPEGAIPD